VYKNGLTSTLTKYRYREAKYYFCPTANGLLCRLMREPKPLVVGISWVVECAEQCRRVEEDNFLVDLEGLNVAGNNKVRIRYRRVAIFAEVLEITAPTFDDSQTYLVSYANSCDGTRTCSWSFLNRDVDQ
jgi:hypothetical protein